MWLHEAPHNKQGLDSLRKWASGLNGKATEKWDLTNTWAHANLAAQAKNVILVALSQQSEPAPAWKLAQTFWLRIWTHVLSLLPDVFDKAIKTTDRFSKIITNITKIIEHPRNENMAWSPHRMKMLDQFRATAEATQTIESKPPSR